MSVEFNILNEGKGDTLTHLQGFWEKFIYFKLANYMK